jgi:TolA-binding protein
MKAEDQKKLNNLYLRYQNYDNDGTKYFYDINFSTLSSNGQQKAKRHTGVEKFREHIEDLMQNYKDVSVITVTDYTGKSPKANPINSPMDIYLLDVKSIDASPKIIMHEKEQPEPQVGRQTGTDILQGLSGLFVGTEYEGLGNIAPLAKFIDDKHVISRLTEKNTEQTQKITELERKNNEWQQKYETLNGSFEKLQDDADDMDDELNEYRRRDKKHDKWVSVVDAAGASIAKNFIRQNPNILSGIIPAEQLAGILSDDDTAQPDTQRNNHTDEEQNRLEDATTAFEWLQTLDETAFEKVISIISVLRQNTAYADNILSFLNGNNKLQPR